MADDQFIPGDVISLSSGSDDDSDEPSPPRKRTFDDAQASAGDASSSNSRSSKRARVDPPPKARADGLSSEEGEIDEKGAKSSAESSGKEQAVIASTSTGIDSQPSGQNAVKKGAGSAKPQTSAGGSFMQASPPTHRIASHAYKLPAFSDKKKGSWYVRFQDWVHVFFVNNLEHADAITPAVAHAAYIHFIDQHSGIKKGKKKPAKSASKSTEDSGLLSKFIAEIRSSGVVEQHRLVESAPKSHDQVLKSQLLAAGDARVAAAARASESYSLPNDLALPNGTSNPSKPKSTDLKMEPSGAGIPRATTDAPSGLEEREQQHKYFPSARDPSNMCLLCGREGHKAAACSHRACRFCGTNEHWDFSCPTRLRCDKCRQLGHRATGCIEKLALTKAEGLACGFCASPDHLEPDCTQIWRSFHPEPDAIHTVVSIPFSCATCGSGQHFSADCAQRRTYAGNPTWSANNHSRYVDPNCESLPIEESGGRRDNAKNARAPELKIRGHAARTTNVHYSESDESDVEFLGARPSNQRPPLGQIRMASNIQMPAKPGGGRGRNQPSAQPPLPPGPPPPGPPPSRQQYDYPPPPGVSSYSSRPAAPPSSLPTKPPPRDYRNVPPPAPHGPRDQAWQSNDGNASQGRGRGRGQGGRGRGGRGRGRGRGRGN